MVDAFRVNRGDRDGYVVLQLAGDLDLLAKDSMQAAIQELRPLADPLLLDLSGLDFVDSTGLNCLLTARSVSLEESGQTLHLLAPGPRVRRLLALTDTAGLFVVLD